MLTLKSPRSAALALLMMATGSSVGCETEKPTVRDPVPSDSGGGSGAAHPDPPAPSGSSSDPSTTAAGPLAADDGGQARCGGDVCEFDWECVDGQCSPFLQACGSMRCGEDEHCNVYQCYRPLLCGPGLPACPEMTYCEDYEEGGRSCASFDHRLSNREFCARMDAGSEWLKAHGHSPGHPGGPSVGTASPSGSPSVGTASPSGSRARGTCFPVMAPHRMGAIRWYQTLGRSAMSGLK